MTAGLQYDRSMNLVNSSYPNGYVNVFWGGTFVNPDGTRLTGDYGYYEVNDLGLKGSAGTNTYSIFFQDQWHLTPRLTLDAGLRTEHESVPSFRSDVRKTAATFGWRKTLVPRLSAAYDILGDSTVRFVGNWGRYNDWTKYAIARESFGGRIWRTYYRAIDDPNVLPSVELDNMPGHNLWLGPGEFRDNLRPNFDSIDPMIRPMSQTSLSVGTEFQVSARSSIVVRYVRNNLVRTIEDMRAELDGKAVYVLGNPGEGRARIMAPSSATAAFSMPRPKRQYDALELSWRRRLSGRWFASANYTLSRLYGNYAGLADSDEIRTPAMSAGYPTAQQQDLQIAREGGNLNSNWDIDEVLWDSHGNLDPRGRLATDRPQVLKMFGSYEFSTGTSVGGFFYAGSGTPISTYVLTANRSSVFVNGRGDMGRTPFLTQTDLRLSHDIRLLPTKTLRLELDVLNLFNNKTARHAFNYYNRGIESASSGSAVNLAKIDLAQGYDYRALVAATPDGMTQQGARDPRYGLVDLWNAGRQASVTARFVY